MRAKNAVIERKTPRDDSTAFHLHVLQPLITSRLMSLFYSLLCLLELEGVLTQIRGGASAKYRVCLRFRPLERHQTFTQRAEKNAASVLRLVFETENASPSSHRETQRCGIAVWSKTHSIHRGLAVVSVPVFFLTGKESHRHKKRPDALSIVILVKREPPFSARHPFSVSPRTKNAHNAVSASLK